VFYKLLCVFYYEWPELILLRTSYILWTASLLLLFRSFYSV